MSAWDVSTASYDDKYKSVNSEDTNPRDVSFKSDGTKMYIMGTTNDTVFQYSLPAAGPANLKSYNGLAIASMKSIMGLGIADIKSVNGLE